MDFGEALRALRAGARVARSGWNGKGQWLELMVPDEHGVMTLPYIFIRTVQGDRVPWLASQTDMLAGDWGVCPGSREWRPADQLHGVASYVAGALEGHKGVTRQPGMLEDVARHATQAVFDAITGKGYHAEPFG